MTTETEGRFRFRTDIPDAPMYRDLEGHADWNYASKPVKFVAKPAPVSGASALDAPADPAGSLRGSIRRPPPSIASGKLQARDSTRVLVVGGRRESDDGAATAPATPPQQPSQQQPPPQQKRMSVFQRLFGGSDAKPASDPRAEWLSSLSVGSSVLAQSTKDNLWYRAMLTEYHPNSPDAVVLYVDFGTAERVSTSRLKELPAIAASSLSAPGAPAAAAGKDATPAAPGVAFSEFERSTVAFDADAVAGLGEGPRLPGRATSAMYDMHFDTGNRDSSDDDDDDDEGTTGDVTSRTTSAEASMPASPRHSGSGRRRSSRGRGSSSIITTATSSSGGTSGRDSHPSHQPGQSDTNKLSRKEKKALAKAEKQRAKEEERRRRASMERRKAAEKLRILDLMKQHAERERLTAQRNKMRAREIEAQGEAVLMEQRQAERERKWEEEKKKREELAQQESLRIQRELAEHERKLELQAEQRRAQLERRESEQAMRAANEMQHMLEESEALKLQLGIDAVQHAQNHANRMAQLAHERQLQAQEWDERMRDVKDSAVQARRATAAELKKEKEFEKAQAVAMRRRAEADQKRADEVEAHNIQWRRRMLEATKVYEPLLPDPRLPDPADLAATRRGTDPGPWSPRSPRGAPRRGTDVAAMPRRVTETSSGSRWRRQRKSPQQATPSPAFVKGSRRQGAGQQRDRSASAQQQQQRQRGGADARRRGGKSPAAAINAQSPSLGTRGRRAAAGGGGDAAQSPRIHMPWVVEDRSEAEPTVDAPAREQDESRDASEVWRQSINAAGNAISDMWTSSRNFFASLSRNDRDEKGPPPPEPPPRDHNEEARDGGGGDGGGGMLARLFSPKPGSSRDAEAKQSTEELQAKAAGKVKRPDAKTEQLLALKLQAMVFLDNYSRDCARALKDHPRDPQVGQWKAYIARCDELRDALLQARSNSQLKNAIKDVQAFSHAR